MRKHWLYFSYVFKHKLEVAKKCFRYGLYWRGLIHDWSKFLPSEWFAYSNFFYGNHPKWSSISSGEKMAGYPYELTKEYWAQEFDKSWNKHQKRNTHHWQYHILTEDSGKVITLRMPYKDVLEMVADWRGAGIAINGYDDTKNWYNKNKKKIKLHPETRKEVEELLEEIK